MIKLLLLDEKLEPTIVVISRSFFFNILLKFKMEHSATGSIIVI